MRKVYVVTEGEYSDYHIVAIFTSRAIAENAKCGDEIEEWDLNGMLPKMPMFSVDAPYKGRWEVENMGLFPSSYYSSQPKFDLRTYDYREEIGRDPMVEIGGVKVRGKTHYRVIRKMHLRAYVRAKDEEHARKIVNEQKAQMIASGEFKPGEDIGEE